MRKQLRKFLPSLETIRANRWLAVFGEKLHHPRLWHLNRHSAAGGVAVGLFCGLIPGPFQILGAAILAVVLRVNFPLALLTTFYTNPLTIVPLYLVAYELGMLVMGNGGGFIVPPDFSFSDMSGSVKALLEWMGGLGKPLFIGLLMLATTLSTIGYLAMRGAWRFYLVRAWHHRRALRRGR